MNFEISNLSLNPSFTIPKQCSALYLKIKFFNFIPPLLGTFQNRPQHSSNNYAKMTGDCVGWLPLSSILLSRGYDVMKMINLLRGTSWDFLDAIFAKCCFIPLSDKLKLGLCYTSPTLIGSSAKKDMHSIFSGYILVQEIKEKKIVLSIGSAGPGPL